MADLQGTLVALATVDGVQHVAVAYDADVPTAEGHCRGECWCGWHTEGYAPAALLWPTLRAHVMNPGPPVRRA